MHALAPLSFVAQIHELSSGRLLANLVFECSMTSIETNMAESVLYAGGANGTIYQVDLFKSVSTLPSAYVRRVCVHV